MNKRLKNAYIRINKSFLLIQKLNADFQNLAQLNLP